MKIKNYYRILGLESSATSDEIRMAYKRLVRKYHPDLHPDDKKIQRVFSEIKEAYEVLSNLDERLKYNLLLSKSKKLMDEVTRREYEMNKKK
ncbi:MAG: DnaJ domain-containing protein [Candidatus Kapaibacterium sp.]|nr:J domain-containing protein [Ignavibacteriota bacterium]MCB9221423.1 J domain-containing protein [Ignavibacteria bacterium]